MSSFNKGFGDLIGVGDSPGLLDKNDNSSVFLLYKKMAPFDAITVPNVSLRIPDPTDWAFSASINISPSSSREER